MNVHWKVHLRSWIVSVGLIAAITLVIGETASASQGRRSVARTASMSRSTSSASVASSNLCGLVTINQVSTITGHKVTKRVLAPLGPTCIYYYKTPRLELTLSVGSTNITTLTKHMTKRKKVTISHRSSYCGDLGGPSLDVSLPKGKTLTIAGTVLSLAGKCETAQRLAKILIPHLVP